jgi:phosphohistidine swiveling domain-containing protein
VPGVAIGRVRHVLGSGDASGWSAGEVLIYPVIPAWPVLSRARPAAVVAERVPTDTASLAGLATFRRHGIPTVVGVTGARGRFPEGRAVMVDATVGTVRRVSAVEPKRPVRA